MNTDNSIDYAITRRDLNNGWFKKFSDFSAGIGDTVSFGATSRIRCAAGYDDAVDYNSSAYRVGTYAGQVVNIGFMAANPAALANSAAWMRTAFQAFNVNGAVQSGN